MKILCTNAALRARFFSKTTRALFEVKPDIGPCLLWTGATRNGYGHFAMPGGPQYAHRVAFALARGRAPRRGFDVRHRCDDRRCVEQAHLREGRRLANVRDSVRQGRHSHGASHGLALLDDGCVRLIRTRAATGERREIIAADFDVSLRTIYAVVARRSWRHVS